MSCFACRAGLVSLAAVLLLVMPGPTPAQRRGFDSPATIPQQMPASLNQEHVLSTAPRSIAPVDAGRYGTPYIGGYGGYGYPGTSYPGFGPGGVGYGAGQALQGAASYTQAQGEYWNSIEQARITREQSRQASIDTQRKQLEWEMEYEKLRPTAPKLLAQEKATDLDWARNFAQNSEIFAGSTFNVLLKSIFKSPYAFNGPNLPLSQSQLAGLNLREVSTRGSLALAKDGGQIAWTEALQEEAFDSSRDPFSKAFEAAIKGVGSGKPPTPQTLRGLRADWQKLSDKLDDQVRDLPPSRYIESRRLLTQLNDTIKGLSNPRQVAALSNDWRQNVQNVAGLASYMQKNGLEFGPASAPGDYPTYTSVYYPMRNYEMAINPPAPPSSSLKGQQ